MDRIHRIEIDRRTPLHHVSERRVRPFEPIREEDDTEEFQELLRGFFKENQVALSELIASEEEEIESIESVASTSPFAFSSVATAAAAQNATAAIELFEKMIDEMTRIHHNGDSKTTFFVTAPGSLFCGSQILIEEFSTAPKTFNITLLSHQNGVATFNANLASLMQQFKQKELSFSIHRLEVTLLNNEEPLYLRKDRDKKEENELANDE